MTAGIGHWARYRLAERRAIAEYRHAWRRLRRLHDAPDLGQRESASKAIPPSLNSNLHMTTSTWPHEEES